MNIAAKETKRPTTLAEKWRIDTAIGITITPPKMAKLRSATDALSGKRLLAAVEPVYTHHDDVKHDARRYELGSAEMAYRVADAVVTKLVADAELLLSQSRLPGKQSWQARLINAKIALSRAKNNAAAGEWHGALGQQEYALTVAHHVLDMLKSLGRRGAKDAGAAQPPYKPGDLIRLRNGRQTTVTKVVKAENLFHEPEYYVSTTSGDVVIVKPSSKERN